ncbi:MAG: hypothetical protein K2Y39_18685 [Candidatus Obscuribacterales bacterium]|nr:hypothetical protein [Candidatus Obscuribacterales bacterium]
MARLIICALVCSAIALGLSIHFLGLAWTLAGLFTILLCRFGYRVYATHLDYLAAETTFFDQIDSWKTSGGSRKAKQAERKNEIDWQARATILAMLTPAARYRDCFAGQANHLLAEETSGEDAYPALIRGADGNWVRQRQSPHFNLQIIHENSPVVDFSAPAEWMRELNEKDRNKSSLRKGDLKINAVLMCMLYHSGPSAVRREIETFRRKARHKKDAQMPSINPHLEHLSRCNQLVIWLALRLFEHQSIALLKPLTKAPPSIEWRA